MLINVFVTEFLANVCIKLVLFDHAINTVFDLVFSLRTIKNSSLLKFNQLSWWRQLKNDNNNVTTHEYK